MSSKNQSQNLKPEFKQKFVKNLQGKEFVLYNGLISLAKDQGILSLTSKILQYPNADNNNTVIVEATVVGYDEVNGEKVQVTYTGVGDANVGNCNKMVGAHFIRMADTRAKGRALRDFLGIDMVMSEELGGDAYTAPMVTKAQTELIGKLFEEKKVAKSERKAFAEKTCGTGNIKEYTKDMGDKLIKALQALA